MVANAKADEQPTASSSRAGCDRTRATAPCAPDAEKLAAVNAIAARLMRLSLLAIEAAGHVVGRLELGQERYGDPDVDRDWDRDRDEELLDQATYDGLIAVARRERVRRQQVAITFDVSDVEEPTQPRTRVVTIPPALPEPSASFDFVDGEVIEVLR